MQALANALVVKLVVFILEKSPIVIGESQKSIYLAYLNQEDIAEHYCSVLALEPENEIDKLI